MDAALFDASRWSWDRVGDFIGLPLLPLVRWVAATLAVALVSTLLDKRLRRGLLLVSSLAFAGLFLEPRVVVFLLASTLLVHQVSATPLLSDAARLPVGAVLLGGVVLPAIFLGGLVRFEDDKLAGGAKVTAFLLVIFFKKAVYFLFERSTGREPGSLGDALVYFLSLPFLLGKAVVPAPSHFHARYKDEVSLADVASGARTMGLALLHLAGFLLLVASPAMLIVSHRLVNALDELTWGTVYAAVALNYAGIYLFRYGWEQLAVGGARMLGIAIDDNYANPLAARDYADFWRRWNMHFREMVVRIFYYPTVLKLNRSRPGHKATAVLIACFVTFAGHGVFMVLARGILIPLSDSEGWMKVMVTLAIYEVFQAVLVAATLLLQDKRRRRRWGRPGLWLGIFLTFHLRALLVMLILRRGVDLGGLVAILGKLVGLAL